MSEVINRRSLLGAAATAAAVGFTASLTKAAESSAEDRPRLPLIVVLREKLSDENDQKLRAISSQIKVLPADSFRDSLGEIDAIYGSIGADDVKAAKKLRWVQCISAGVEHLLTPPLIESDIVVTNGKGCYAPEIAEHVFGLLFAMTRRIGYCAREQRNHKWQNEVDPIELRGKTMGIIGLGGIGRETARRAKAMDLHVIAVDAEPMTIERMAMVDEVRLVDDGLDDLLGQSDIVVNATPFTKRTHHMLGADQFAKMKQGAYFINVSRGRIVQTDALMAALRSKHLAGAGLDVTDPEPLPADHPLWDEPNIFITPHIAGVSQFGRLRVQNVFVENVRRFTSSLPLLNQVDKIKGY
ncbi:MAG TPA: D-2-hydroxyacid dehydrogenase [Tepidisphaeraceae bacterium]|nr:D-2-hydroxyacid dehydrogenase [Tepidisphaeraceae bacterium]